LSWRIILPVRSASLSVMRPRQTEPVIPRGGGAVDAPGFIRLHRRKAEADQLAQVGLDSHKAVLIPLFILNRISGKDIASSL
jgi:hypothetical protein